MTNQIKLFIWGMYFYSNCSAEGASFGGIVVIDQTFIAYGFYFYVIEFKVIINGVASSSCKVQVVLGFAGSIGISEDIYGGVWFYGLFYFFQDKGVKICKVR